MSGDVQESNMDTETNPNQTKVDSSALQTEQKVVVEEVLPPYSNVPFLLEYPFLLRHIFYSNEKCCLFPAISIFFLFLCFTLIRLSGLSG